MPNCQFHYAKWWKWPTEIITLQICKIEQDLIIKFHQCSQNTLGKYPYEAKNINRSYILMHISIHKGWSIFIYRPIEMWHINGLVQDCSNSIANALELLQSCTEPSINNHARLTRCGVHISSPSFDHAALHNEYKALKTPHITARWAN